MCIYNKLLVGLVLLIISSNSFSEDLDIAEKKVPRSLILHGKSGAVVDMILFPTRNNKINAQIPVFKKLSSSDSSLVQSNIKKTNRIIYRVIQRIDKSGNWLTATSKLLEDTPEYTSIEIDEEISDMTERYFTWFILMDKKTGLPFTSKEAITRYGFTIQKIQNAVKDWVKPCINVKNEDAPDKCQDVVIEQFVYNYFDDGSPSFSDILPSGVYFKDGHLGVSYDITKFTQTFEFDLKTKKIVNP